MDLGLDFVEEFNVKGGGKESKEFYEQAIYFAMDQVRRVPGVEALRIARHDFYYSPSTQLALYLRVCRYHVKPGTTRARRKLHPHDVTNGLLICSTLTLQSACSALLTQYPNAVFACGIGMLIH